MVAWALSRLLGLNPNAKVLIRVATRRGLVRQPSTPSLLASLCIGCAPITKLVHIAPRRGLVRQLSIDQLDNEGRRVSIYDKALPNSGDGAGAASTGDWGASQHGVQVTVLRCTRSVLSSLACAALACPPFPGHCLISNCLLAERESSCNNRGLLISSPHPGPAPPCPSGKSPLFTRSLSMPGVHKRVIHELLRPRQWKPNHEDRRFMLSVSGPAGRAHWVSLV